MAAYLSRSVFFTTKKNKKHQKLFTLNYGIMKKNRLFFMFAALFVSAAVLFSCQKEEVVSFEDGVMLKVATATTPDCIVDCIDLTADEVVYFPVTDQVTVQWGGKNNDNNTKVVDLRYYNTETDFVIEFKSTHSPQTLYVDDVPVSVVLVDGWFQYTIELDDEWEACDLVEYAVQVDGQGSPAHFGTIGYNLIGICSDCDLEGNTFTGVAKSCGTSREVVYTFSSEEGVDYFEIQGGLTNFTGADAVVTVFGGAEIVKSQWTPGNSSNRIINVKGELGECESVVITITWNSTNSGGVITGDWTVVNAYEVELAPGLAGLECE
jgi:hypothetical protein